MEKILRQQTKIIFAVLIAGCCLAMYIGSSSERLVCQKHESMTFCEYQRLEFFGTRFKLITNYADIGPNIRSQSLKTAFEEFQKGPIPSTLEKETGNQIPFWLGLIGIILIVIVIFRRGVIRFPNR